MAAPRISWITRDLNIILERNDIGWKLIGGDRISDQDADRLIDSGLEDCAFPTRNEALAAAQTIILDLDTRLRMYDIMLDQDTHFYDIYRLGNGHWRINLTRVTAIREHLPTDHPLQGWTEDEWIYSHHAWGRWINDFVAPHNRSRAGVARAVREWLQVVCEDQKAVERWVGAARVWPPESISYP